MHLNVFAHHEQFRKYPVGHSGMFGNVLQCALWETEFHEAAAKKDHFHLFA